METDRGDPFVWDVSILIGACTHHRCCPHAKVGNLMTFLLGKYEAPYRSDVDGRYIYGGAGWFILQVIINV